MQNDRERQQNRTRADVDGVARYKEARNRPAPDRINQNVGNPGVGGFSDIDYGCNADNPEDVIATILDDAGTAHKIMNELNRLGFQIVRRTVTDAIGRLQFELTAARNEITLADEQIERMKRGTSVALTTSAVA